MEWAPFLLIMLTLENNMAFQRRHREIQRPNTVGFEGEQQPENMASVRMTHVRQSAVKWTGSYQSSHTLPGLGTLQNCGVINFCCFKPQKKKNKNYTKANAPFYSYPISLLFPEVNCLVYIFLAPSLCIYEKICACISVWCYFWCVCL